MAIWLVMSKAMLLFFRGQNANMIRLVLCFLVYKWFRIGCVMLLRVCHHNKHSQTRNVNFANSPK